MKLLFEPGVFLLTKDQAKNLVAGIEPKPEPEPTHEPGTEPEPVFYPVAEPGSEPDLEPETKIIRLTGQVPPEVWNRLGTKILPKLRSGKDLQIGINFSVTVESSVAKSLNSDLRLILEDLGLSEKVRIE